jgi:hypothetical protein
MDKGQAQPNWFRPQAPAGFLTEHYRSAFQQSERDLLEVLQVRPESELQSKD